MDGARSQEETRPRVGVPPRLPGGLALLVLLLACPAAPAVGATRAEEGGQLRSHTLASCANNTELEAKLWESIDKDDGLGVVEAIRCGADPEKRCGLETPLTHAAAQCHPGVVLALLRGGARVDGRGGSGWTPLQLAVGAERGEVAAAVLIQAGADVRAANQDYRGWTPLHSAAMFGPRVVAQWLVEAGAEVNARTDYNQTPLHLAMIAGRTQMVDYLKSMGGVE